MATKHTSTCLKNAEDQEPIFVLRATDPTAPSLIRAWVAANQQASKRKLEGALVVAAEMDAWPTKKEAD